jgi:hypothetical protein
MDAKIKVPKNYAKVYSGAEVKINKLQTTALEAGTSFRLRSLYAPPPRINPEAHWRDCTEPTDSFDMTGERRNRCPCPESNFHRPAGRQPLCWLGHAVSHAAKGKFQAELIQPTSLLKIYSCTNLVLLLKYLGNINLCPIIKLNFSSWAGMPGLWKDGHNIKFC